MDLPLLVKYSQPGPRYTSYPPAPHFSASFDPAYWQDELIQSQDPARPISLYIHIPFCDTLCYYCGCNMVATGDYAKADRYLAYLIAEIDRVAALTYVNREVVQMHWGGGTPTYLHPADIRGLAAHLRKRFRFTPDAEVAVEVDPRGLTREHVIALRESGFNRASLGVQDLDETVQKAVNRVQPLALIEEVYGWFRSEGFASINLDLMTGLPHQTLDSYRRTLAEIVRLNPDRLAVFGYAHVPWLKKHQKLILEPDLPNFESRMSMQELILETLEAAGYVHIGMDHFAKPEDSLVQAQRNRTLWRNFQGYTTHRHADIYAFGVSAISQTETVYAQNEKRLVAYQQKIDRGELATEKGYRLSRDDRIRRDVITELMCDLELNMANISQRWCLEFDVYFADSLKALAPLAQDGLVQVSGGVIRVTALGRLFLRNIAMCFDAYLRRKSGSEQPRYSKTA
ncbi:MAG TPA: oxygen-independent coproporphyrinogen III oxidase [Thiobacillaceae bacterium]|nr:oxygen-independent coproporphyrinogen III oxidase [Thiobacillaceae bacterium]